MKFSKFITKLMIFSFLTFSTIAIVASKPAHANIPDATYNTSSNSLTRVMCNTLRIVTGSAGKTFAAFAIIAVGIGFFSGKVSWGLMIGVAVGIAAMFGAPSIVAAISGQNTDMQCAIN